MNIEPGRERARNSGSERRRAAAATSSEGGMLGRMVRSHEPKEAQATRG